MKHIYTLQVSPFKYVKHKLTWTQRSRVTKKMEMERKRRNMRNQALQWSQLLRPIILMYSWNE